MYHFKKVVLRTLFCSRYCKSSTMCDILLLSSSSVLNLKIHSFHFWITSNLPTYFKRKSSILTQREMREIWVMRLGNVYYIRQKCQSREKYLTSFSCFQVENSLSTYEPHACVVVYSIVARASFQHAEETLNYLWREGYTKEKSVIVVGNKADLARSRMISANGKCSTL